MLVTQSIQGKMYFLTLLATDDWYFVYVWVGYKTKYEVCHSLSWDSVLKKNTKLLILIVKSDFGSTHTHTHR